MFITTSLLLITVCMMTYLLIACFLPKTYSTDLTRSLMEDTELLVERLEETTIEESDKLFDDFILNNMVELRLTDSTGEEVELPANVAISYAPVETSDSISTDVNKGEYNISFKIASSSGSDDFVYGVKSDSQRSSANLFTTTFSSIGIGHAYSFSFKGSDEEYTLTVFGDMTAVNQAAQSLKRTLPYLAVIILLTSFAGAWLYSRYVTRPVINISRISKKMSNMEFDWHCDETRKDEIGTLAKSLNELSEKLDVTLSQLKDANASLKEDIEFEREQEKKRLAFFSAVSHELKTPITIVKGQLEGMLMNVGVYRDRDKYLNRSLEVVGSMEELVQEILYISRMESSGFKANKSRLNFSMLVRRYISDCKPLFDRKHMTVNAEVEDDLMVEADERLLRKAVSNLIENAVNYSPEKSQVNIKAYTCNNGEVAFEIENLGHIPEDSVQRLFDAFYRVEKSRNRVTGGSGLGLYVVKMIMELHHAEYRIENADDTVRFTFMMPEVKLF